MSDYSVLQLDEILKSVAKYAAFSLGKEKILDLKPSKSKLYIQQELDRLKEAIELVVSFGSFPLAGIKDISDSLYASLRGLCLNPLELLDIATHAYSCDDLKKYFKDSKKENAELSDLVNSLSYSLELSKEINRCIDTDGSIKDNASAKLKTLRKSLITCEAKLRSEADKYTKQNANLLSETVTTIRNDRFVVLAKASNKNTIGGFVHGESNSHQTLYVDLYINYL